MGAISLEMPRNMRILCVLSLFILFSLSGCGTLVSRYASGDAYIDHHLPLKRMYSGTILDVYNLGAENVGLFLFMDIPLSLTADTVLLPMTIHEEFFTGQLQKAAAKGDIDTVKAMLNKGSDLHARTLGGHTALMSAAWGGQTTMVQMLLDNGAEANAKHAHSGATALRYALLKGHAAVIEVLLRNGADVHANEECCWTALMAAAEAGHATAVQALLANGADVHAKDAHGRTALNWAMSYHWTMWYRQREIIQLLKNAGAREE